MDKVTLIEYREFHWYCSSCKRNNELILYQHERIPKTVICESCTEEYEVNNV